MDRPIIFGNAYGILLALLVMSVAFYYIVRILGLLQPNDPKFKFRLIAGASLVYIIALSMLHVLVQFVFHRYFILDWYTPLRLLLCVAFVFSSFRILQSRLPYGRRLFMASCSLSAGSLLLNYSFQLTKYVTFWSWNGLLFACSVLVSLLGTCAALHWSGKKSIGHAWLSASTASVTNVGMHLIGLCALRAKYTEDMLMDQVVDQLLLLVFLLSISIVVILSASTMTWFAGRRYNQLNVQYEQFIENAMDMFALIRNGRWEYVNPTGLRMFELERESDILGKSVYDFLQEKHRAEVRRMVEDALESERLLSKPVEIEWQTASGAQLYTETILARTGEAGSGLYQAIIRDISERKHNEEMFIHSEKLYVAGQLAAGIAHEIRNPLTTLKGFLQLIASGENRSEHYYDIMKSELQQIESTINELLMVSKPQMVELVRRDVIGMMAETVKLLKTEAILHDIVIDVEADHNRPLWVFGVESQIKQVFVNVLSNAIEAMPDGGVIRVAMELEGERTVKIAIRDEGSGMSKEQLAKLGQPFYTTKERGTGLGLMVTYKIIDNHLGSIRVSSEMGAGTSFFIRLPYSAEEPFQNGGNHFRETGQIET